MKLPGLPGNVIFEGEINPPWCDGLVMLPVAALAYLVLPRWLTVEPDVWFTVAIFGICAFFGLSFLIPQPRRFISLRALGLLLIGAGILASIWIVRGSLEFVSIPASRERSFAVSAFLLLAGLTSLSAYWFLNGVAGLSQTASKAARRNGGA